jgi:translation initiation factor IF-1
MARQVTDTVTVKEIDHKDHTITFETEDGRTVTARLGDRNLPRDIDPGDRVEVTWTNAMLVSVEG